MKTLITGNAGFIGSHTVKKFLSKGHSVVGIDSINSYYSKKLKFNRLKDIKNFSEKNNNKYKFYKIDLTNKKSIDKIFKNEKIKMVIHLAAQAGVRYSIKNPDAYVKSNLIGFSNILESCRKYKIKHLIFASTSSVYGDSNLYPFKETQNLAHPLQFYAATKLSNELMAHSYSHLFKLPVTGLRFFTVYGPWGRPDMSLFLFTEKILKGKKIQIFNYGKHKRDFTYIDDIVDGIYKISFKPPKSKKNFNKKRMDPSLSFAPYRILNIGNSKPVNLIAFLNYLEKCLKKRAKKEYLPLQAGDIIKTHSNISKIKKLINYSPKTNYKIGIKKFVAWYLNYRNIT